MEKKEIITLLCAVSAVFLFIFVLAKIKPEEEAPAANVTVEPGEIVQTGENAETDIWDVLHAMNTTAAAVQEPETVSVTAVNENGEVYTVTDTEGNAVTEIVPAAVQEADGADAADPGAGNDHPAEAPVINVTPGQQTPADQVDSPYFVVIPADE